MAEKFDEVKQEFQRLTTKLKDTTDLVERKLILIKMKGLIDKIDRLTSERK
jgi:hypothetical protein